MINENRIVRIFNDDIHNTIEFAAMYCEVPYQRAFEVWCILMASGYTHTNGTLFLLVDKIEASKKI